ncbi:MAG: hypothetical protein ACKVH8_11300 [Pirellulales bacterium]
MAYGHTDDVPKTVDLEAKPTPESSAVLPKIGFRHSRTSSFNKEH